MTRIGLIAAIAILPGCAKTIMPRLGPPMTPAPVSASFDHTWEATVSWFAERNISIQTIEKASGIIVADVPVRYMPNRTVVLGKNGKPMKYAISAPVYADCGSQGPMVFDPSSMIYNIRVLGDASRSTVQVNSRYLSNWGSAQRPLMIDCASTGKWESDIQSYIKSHAEVGK